MKWNWGTGIAITYGVFVVGMVFMVYLTTRYDVGMVSDHYYDEDLQYQKRIDKMNNSQALQKDLQIRYQAPQGLVEFTFPSEVGAASGDIVFFRPSDRKEDFKIPIKTDSNNSIAIPVSKIAKGLWKVEVEWSAGGKGYYKEQVLTI